MNHPRPQKEIALLGCGGLGIFVALVMLLCAAAFGLGLWFGGLHFWRIDWLLLKKLITWAVVLRILWHLGSWAQAKGKS